MDVSNKDMRSEITNKKFNNLYSSTEYRINDLLYITLLKVKLRTLNHCGSSSMKTPIIDISTIMYEIRITSTTASPTKSL